MDIESVIGDLEQPERTVRICLKGKLIAEHENLVRQFEEANKNAIATMGGRGEAAEIAGKIRDTEAAMEAASVTFRVRGISYFEREEWRKAHPPRDGEKEIFNPVTAAPALIAACLVDPKATVDQARRLMERAGTGQADKLFNACLEAIGEDGSVPFSLAASATLRALEQKPE